MKMTRHSCKVSTEYFFCLWRVHCFKKGGSHNRFAEKCVVAPLRIHGKWHRNATGTEIFLQRLWEQALQMVAGRPNVFFIFIVSVLERNAIPHQLLLLSLNERGGYKF